VFVQLEVEAVVIGAARQRLESRFEVPLRDGDDDTHATTISGSTSAFGENLCEFAVDSVKQHKVFDIHDEFQAAVQQFFADLVKYSGEVNAGAKKNGSLRSRQLLVQNLNSGASHLFVCAESPNGGLGRLACIEEILRTERKIPIMKEQVPLVLVIDLQAGQSELGDAVYSASFAEEMLAEDRVVQKVRELLSHLGLDVALGSCTVRRKRDVMSENMKDLIFRVFEIPNGALGDLQLVPQFRDPRSRKPSQDRLDYTT
jgi:hypothetical protein